MIWNDFHFYARTLGVQTAAHVLLPDLHVLEQQGGAPLPTLYLLHGLSDDHTMWLRQSRIEQYARKYRLAVVMPAVNRSFYTDMAHGAQYFTFVSEELPMVMEAYFPLSREREGRFAAGLSMGGYGAMKLGLRCPERYAAVASLSGSLEMEKAFEPESGRAPEFLRELEDIYGSEQALKAGKDNLSLLAERGLESKAAFPRIYVACGTDDDLFSANDSFVRRFGKQLAIDYHVDEGATHSWDCWDARIQDVLRWLNVPGAENVW